MSEFDINIEIFVELLNRVFMQEGCSIASLALLKVACGTVPPVAE